MTSFTFFLFFIPILATLLLAINFIFAPYNPNAEKRTAFECGFHSFLGQNRSQFTVSFYIFGLLFLLFDLEILLIYPYAMSSIYNDIFGLLTMLLFFILLTVGFVFELGKKALFISSRQTASNVKLANFSLPTLLASSYILLDDLNITICNVLNEFSFSYIYNSFLLGISLSDFYFIFIILTLIMLLVVLHTSNIGFAYVCIKMNTIFSIYSIMLCIHFILYLISASSTINDILYMNPSGDDIPSDIDQDPSTPNDGGVNPSMPTGGGENPSDPNDNNSNPKDEDDNNDKSMTGNDTIQNNSGITNNGSNNVSDDSSTSDSDENSEDEPDPVAESNCHSNGPKWARYCPHFNTTELENSAGLSCTRCDEDEPDIACIKCGNVYHEDCLTKRSVAMAKSYPHLYFAPKNANYPWLENEQEQAELDAQNQQEQGEPSTVSQVNNNSTSQTDNNSASQMDTDNASQENNNSSSQEKITSLQKADTTGKTQEQDDEMDVD